jgi:hypothetical protein
VNRRLVVVPSVAGTLFGLVASGGTTTGSGTPAATTDTTTGGGAPSSSGGTGGMSMASLQPCDLLSSSNASQLQLTPGGAVNEGDARGLHTAEGGRHQRPERLRNQFGNQVAKAVEPGLPGGGS